MQESSKKEEAIMKKFDVDELLQMFVSTEDFRATLKRPWRKDGYIMASDSHILVRVNGDLSDKEYPTNGPAFCFSLGTESIGILTAGDIDDVLTNCPLVDDTRRVEVEVECPECEGEGQVEWQYGIHSEKHDCPMCLGEGKLSEIQEVPTGHKVISSKSFLQMGEQFVGAYYIDLIRKVMDLIGLEAVDVIPNSYQNPILFRLTNGIEIILMPCNGEGKLLSGKLSPVKSHAI